MNLRRLLFVLNLIIGLFLASSNAQENIVDNYPREKVFLHTDRIEYGAGEIIYYKAYLTEDNYNDESILSKVLNVELIDQNMNKVVFQQINITEGQGIGSIETNRKLSTGTYTLRAYTSYMRNFDESIFFRQKILIYGEAGPQSEIVKTPNKVISFYPEGGDLMIGVPQTIAVRTIGDYAGIQETGVIKDHTGKTLTEVKTNDNGFGKFKLFPQENTTYYFENESLKVALPAPVDLSQTLTVITSVNHIIVKVYGDMDISSKVIAISNGSMIWSAPTQEIGFKLPKSELPKGLITFAIVDDQGKPLAERLAFNHKGINHYNIELTSEKDQISSRELLESLIEVYDDNGDPIASDISISVVDHRYHHKNPGIVSQFYLQSEVRGQIDDADEYLKDNTQETINKTDLLLLTQGWRKYNWTKPDEILFPKEKSLSISGRTVKPDNIEEPVKAYGSMSILSTDFALFPIETSEDGYFFFDDINLSDSTTLFFQLSTKKKKGKDKNKDKGGASMLKGNRKIEVLLDNPLVHDVMSYDSIWLNSERISTEAEPRVELFDLPAIAEEEEWYIDESLLLDEITIKEKRFDKWVDYYDKEITYTQPNNRVFTDNVGAIEGYIDIYDVLRGRVPGIEIVGSIDGLSKRSVIIRGRSTGLDASTQANNAAKFLLNGSIVSALTAESIRPQDIAFIDILKSLSQLAQYGEQGSGGLIAIYLKPPGSRARDQEAREKDNGLYLSYQGFTTAKEFYKADYGADAFFQKNEARRTVHWEPNLEVSYHGEANFSFYTSDYLGTYHINIQGMTKEGLPISYQTTILVE